MRFLTYILYRNFSCYVNGNLKKQNRPLLEILIVNGKNHFVIKRHSLTMTSKSNNSEISNNIFNGNPDRFDGVTVDSKNEGACTTSDFSKKLAESLSFWKLHNRRAIWFKVYLEHSEWLPILIKNGFKYHHAKEDFALLYLWLPKEPHNLPPYAHTMIGVGAVVVNDKAQLLVVRERYLNISQWKLPGGYVDPGENLVDAVIREVKEETNISTEFHSVLSLRHVHNAMYGCSDIYTVISLKPLTHEIKKCDREIDDSIWLDIHEFLNHPRIHALNKMFVRKYLEHVRHNIKIDCEHGEHPILKTPYVFYSATRNQVKEKEKGEGSDKALV